MAAAIAIVTGCTAGKKYVRNPACGIYSEEFRAGVRKAPISMPGIQGAFGRNDLYTGVNLRSRRTDSKKKLRQEAPFDFLRRRTVRRDSLFVRALRQ